MQSDKKSSETHQAIKQLIKHWWSTYITETLISFIEIIDCVIFVILSRLLNNKDITDFSRICARWHYCNNLIVVTWKITDQEITYVKAFSLKAFSIQFTFYYHISKQIEAKQIPTIITKIYFHLISGIIAPTCRAKCAIHITTNTIMSMICVHFLHWYEAMWYGILTFDSHLLFHRIYTSTYNNNFINMWKYRTQSAHSI